MKTLQPRPGVVEAHLKRLPVFSGLPEPAREALAHHARLRLQDSGEILFRRGEPALQLFGVVHGAVRVYRDAPGGRQKVLHLLAAPALVAEVPVLMGAQYPATAACSESSTVVVISRQALRRQLARDPELPLRLLGAALERLHELTGSLAAHGERSATARVAAYLMGWARGQPELELPAPKKDVASYLGLQPESLSRALAALREAGAIAVEDKTIRFLDPAALSRLAGES